jgi:hypothetical protein
MEADVTATAPVQMYQGMDAGLKRERVIAGDAAKYAGLAPEDMLLVLPGSEI